MYDDAIWDQIDGLFLPPIAGGAPGPLDSVFGLVGGTIDQELNPLRDFLAGKIDDLARTVWSGVQAAYSLVMRLAFKAALNLLGWLLPPIWLQIYQQWPDNSYFSAGDLFSGMLDILWHAIETAKNWGLTWLKDVVYGFLGYAAHGFGSAFDAAWDTAGQWGRWVYGQVRNGLGYAEHGFGSAFDAAWSTGSSWAAWGKDQVYGFLGYAAHGFGSAFDAAWATGSSWAAWGKDQVYGFLGYAAHGFGSMFDALWDTVRSWSLWVRDNVVNPLLNEIRKLPAQLIAGAQDIFGALKDALAYVFEHLFEPAVDLIQHKLSIPGRVIAGEYPTYDAFLTDILDPPASISKGIELIPIILLLTAVGTLIHFAKPLDPVNEGWKQVVAQKVRTTLIGVGDVMEGWNRGLFTPDQVDFVLASHGIYPHMAEVLKVLRFKLPGESNLIRSGDRGALSGEVSQAFGTYGDLPGGFIDEMGAEGYEPKVATDLWAAHWQLGGLAEAFDMLHRGIIDTPTLGLLLRAHGVAPGIRERLTEASYTLYNRRELPRLLKYGVLTETEVHDAYIHLGVKPDIAVKLTEFARRFASNELGNPSLKHHELSAAEIRTAYRRHVITREAALDKLILVGWSQDEGDFMLDLDDAELARNPFVAAGTPIATETVPIIREAYRDSILSRDQAMMEIEAHGFTPQVADTLLSIEDYTLQRQQAQYEAELVRARYIAYDLDEAGARAQLAAFGIEGVRQDALLAQWANARHVNTRKLTVTEIFHARDRGLLTDDESFAYLLRLGYNEADANVVFNLHPAK